MNSIIPKKDTQMKAIVCEKYGSPDVVLQLKDVAKPAPKDDEVLVTPLYRK